MKITKDTLTVATVRSLRDEAAAAADTLLLDDCKLLIESMTDGDLTVSEARRLPQVRERVLAALNHGNA